VLNLFPNGVVPKVLVGVVTWDRKNYCRKEFVSRIHDLTYDYYEIKEFDTTPNESGVKLTEHYSKGVNSRERTTKAYNRLKEFFLEGNYDYLMIIEADVIPPRYIIEALMAHDKDVCSAVYMIGREKDRHPCLFKKDMVKRKVGSTYLKMLEHYQAKDLDGELWYVDGMSGIGCHLIRGEVLKKITFHHGETHHCDTEFHHDLHKLGIKAYVDTGILCKHYGNATEWLRIQHENDF